LNKPNYTQVSNEFLDERMAGLSGSAVKTFLAITRKTIGWHKDTDAISYSQIRDLTGHGSYSTVKKSIDELLNNGLIRVIKSSGGTTKYEPNMTTTTETVVPDTTTLTVADHYRNCSGTTTQTVDTKETLKETSQKKLTYTDEFNTFWKAYPRNTNKRGAFKCWLKLLKEGEAPERITMCAKNYAAKMKTDKTEPQFILHASTFLGPNRRYEDFETAVKAEGKPQGMYTDKFDVVWKDGIKIGHYDGSRFIPA